MRGGDGKGGRGGWVVEGGEKGGKGGGCYTRFMNNDEVRGREGKGKNEVEKREE